MRKLAAAGVAGLIAAVAATAAFAQPVSPSVTVFPTVTPNKAGTSKHPQGVKLNVRIQWQNLGPATQPIVTKFKVLFPKGAMYNGAHTPSCSFGKINLGPSACPKGSIVGSGTGTAYADTVLTHPQITVVNGGPARVYFYTVLNNPARVQDPVIGTISRTGGKYGYVLNVSVPKILQIVAGVPIALTSLSVTAGRGTWLETTGCSGGHWPFSITTSYLFQDNSVGQTSFTSSAPCRR
jgi:hypothetical protein